MTWTSLSSCAYSFRIRTWYNPFYERDHKNPVPWGWHLFFVTLKFIWLVALNTTYMLLFLDFSQDLSPGLQTHSPMSTCSSTFGVSNTYVIFYMSKFNLLINPSNYLLLQVSPSQLISTPFFQVLRPKKVDSSLFFTLPLYPMLNPSWNMVTSVF
jgi:hypothetical protein